MGRPSRPWWWKDRQCWAVTVNGKRHTAPPVLTKKDRLAARDWHAQLLDDLRPGSIHRAGALTVRMLCKAYLSWDLDRVAKKQRDLNSCRAGATRLDLFCSTKIDGRKLGDKLALQFTAGDLGLAIAMWGAEGRADGYIVSIVSDVKSAWSWAKRPIPGRIPERLIKENPIEDFKGPPVPESEHRYAGRPEAAAWLRWLRFRKVDRSFILLQRALIHSGARPSELVRARWKHVAWEGWTTDAGHLGAIVTLKKHKNVKKTGKSRRVYLSPLVRESLLRGVKGQPDDPERPLFTNSKGHPWISAHTLGGRVRRQRNAAIEAYKKAEEEKKHGLPRSIKFKFTHLFADEGPEALVNYRWRHTAASTLLMNGVDVTTTAELLGTSPDMILRVYGHLLTDHLAGAASKLSRRR